MWVLGEKRIQLNLQAIKIANAVELKYVTKLMGEDPSQMNSVTFDEAFR
jgi:hypothetical protein